MNKLSGFAYAFLAISLAGCDTVRPFASRSRLQEGSTLNVTGETQLIRIQSDGQLEYSAPEPWSATSTIRNGVATTRHDRPTGGVASNILVPDEELAGRGGLPFYALLSSASFADGRPNDSKIHSFDEGGVRYDIVMQTDSLGGPVSRVLVFANRIAAQAVQLRWARESGAWLLQGAAITAFKDGKPGAHLVSRVKGSETFSAGVLQSVGQVAQDAAAYISAVASPALAPFLPKELKAQFFFGPCAKEYKELARIATLMTFAVFGTAGTGGALGILIAATRSALFLDYLWTVYALRDCVMRNRFPQSALSSPDEIPLWLESEIDALLRYCLVQNPYTSTCR